MFEKEISQKSELEHHFKKVVSKVMRERQRANEERMAKKIQTKFYITALDSEPKLTGGQDDYELN